MLLVALMANRSLAQSQFVDAYVQGDSSQAYWRLQAGQASQKPVVQFFDQHHQLLYQEQLPASARLTEKRTARAFDLLLANLTTQRVLATTYLDNPDLFVLPSPSVNPSSSLELRGVIVKKGTVIVDCHPFLRQSDKLMLYFAQAKRRWVAISLEDESQNTRYFEDSSNRTLYRRDLNLSQLPGGTYRLKIYGYFTPFLYRLTVDRFQRQYTLEKLPQID
ncbi:hypothetical protein GCM10028773_51150 [Spirosoma koreense]